MAPQMLFAIIEGNLPGGLTHARECSTGQLHGCYCGQSHLGLLDELHRLAGPSQKHADGVCTRP